MKGVGKSTYSSDITWSWNVKKDNGAFELFFMVAVISFCYLSSKRKNWWVEKWKNT